MLFNTMFRRMIVITTVVLVLTISVMTAAMIAVINHSGETYTASNPRNYNTSHQHTFHNIRPGGPPSRHH